jgi:hypothetical protein
MVADGNMFNGSCNLDLSGACTFDSATDYWHPMASANQILFVTGDRQYWGQAWYADVWSLIRDITADPSPNLTWIDAGRDGASIGSVMGNVLFRTGPSYPYTEDPWITLEGRHCANEGNVAPCNEILWGESSYGPSAAHTNLLMNHGGIEVYAREVSALQVVPEPSTYLLIASGLAAIGLLSMYKRRGAWLSSHSPI